MDFRLTQEQEMFLEIVDKACKETRNAEDHCYLHRQYNDKILPIFKKAGLLAMPIEEKYGGGGMDLLTYVLALERIGEEGCSVRTFFSGHISIGQLVIQEFGNEEQKKRYLPKTTAGEMIMAFGLTESSAGSDPSSLKTTFTKKGDKYLLNGSKAWISNGTIAGLITIFAKDPKSNKISAFLVDTKSKGFSSKREENKMGLHSCDTAQLFLDNVEVPSSNLLGKEGDGLSIAYGTLMNGRLSVAAGCVGVIADCLHESVRYAKERVQHGKEIGKHQLIQRHIADISTQLEAARLLVHRAAVAKMDYLKDRSNRHLRAWADTMVARAKYFATNAAFDAADRAVQIFGANGYSLEFRPGRHLCDTRVTRIYEGTNEILQQKIAVHLLGEEFAAYR